MIYKIVSKYLYKNLRNLILFTIVGILVVILSLLSPYIVGNFIDLLNSTRDFKEVLKYSLIFLMLKILSQILLYISNSLYLKLQLKSSYDFNRDLLNHFQRISILKANKYDSANMVQRLNNDSNSLIIFAINFFKDVLSNLLLVIVSFIIIFDLNKIIAGVVLISIVFYVIFYNMMKKILFKINSHMISAQSDFF